MMLKTADRPMWSLPEVPWARFNKTFVEDVAHLINPITHPHSAIFKLDRLSLVVLYTDV